MWKLGLYDFLVLELGLSDPKSPNSTLFRGRSQGRNFMIQPRASKQSRKSWGWKAPPSLSAFRWEGNRVTNCPEEGFTEIQSIQANTHQSQQTAASDHKMQPATWCWERKTSELHGKSSNSLLISWHSLMACGLLAYYLTLFDCFIAHDGPLFCDLFLLFSGSCIYWLVHTSFVSKCSFPFQVRINTQRLCKHLGPSQVKHITSLIRSSMKWNKMEPTSCREVALMQWKLLYFRISMEPPLLTSITPFSQVMSATRAALPSANSCPEIRSPGSHSTRSS